MAPPYITQEGPALHEVNTLPMQVTKPYASSYNLHFPTQCQQGAPLSKYLTVVTYSHTRHWSYLQLLRILYSSEGFSVKCLEVVLYKVGKYNFPFPAVAQLRTRRIQ